MFFRHGLNQFTCCPAYKKRIYIYIQPSVVVRSFSISFHLSSRATKGAEAFLLLYTPRLAMLDIIGKQAVS